MKRRIETERVKPQHIHRDVKLGLGGISDLEWLVHLTEMRFSDVRRDSVPLDFSDRILALARAQHINALEAEQLVDANSLLRALRAHLLLQGIEDDLIPENPDKLDRVARSIGFSDGNSLLARHQSVVVSVRRMFLECIERIKL
jgi:glutamate-ammonia-ligase adenylyltransferase